jgi:hypothetical protein
MTDTQTDLTHPLRFAIQLAEAEGYAECAAGLRTALDRLTQPTDPQADLTERARAIILRHVRLAPNEYVRNPKTNDMTLDLASVDEAARELAAALQSEREAAAAEARGRRQSSQNITVRVVSGLSGLSRIMKRGSMSDSMPSKRMVPEQQLSELSDEMVRLAAAKDAEIAALEARELDQCPACFWHPGHNPDEWFREEADLRSAALTKMRAEIAALTEQRDRAMKLFEAARTIKVADCIADRGAARARFWDVFAVLDAEAAAETEGN